MTTDNNEVLVALGAAVSGARVMEDGSLTPYAFLPPGYSVHELEFLRESPAHKRAAVKVIDSDSFCAYIADHKTAGTRIYANFDIVCEGLSLVAVLDDHSAGSAGWRHHTCTLDRRKSIEWGRWASKNHVHMPQSDFARFLEENLADIVTAEGMPTGSEMLQMALAFERTADKRLKSKVNLQSGGVRFEYVDDDTAETRTSMQVFSRFAIGIPVFECAKAAYQIEARLKYRDNAGKVAFWYELIRSDRAFRKAVDDELTAISEATGLKIIKGTPGV